MKLRALHAAEAHDTGRAQRSATVRHVALNERPLMVVAFQLGAEPFSAAALGWGRDPENLEFDVAGDPRNRDLIFRLLKRFAVNFNEFFEPPFADYEMVRSRNGHETRVATAIPQIVVPNRETALLLGRLGRRLAYLSTDSEWPADPELIRLGRHLMWVRYHAGLPGQQLLISLADVIDAHWDMALNDWERGALAAVDAFIDPPSGQHGYEAACEADRQPLGPRPDADQERPVQKPMADFNAEVRPMLTHARTTSEVIDWPAIEARLGPIRSHYRPLIDRAWDLSWRCLERERGWGPARSVSLRLAEDRGAYSLHMEWVERTGGLYRTRQTIPQAIRRVRECEAAEQRLAAQVAADDPLKMVDLLASGQAILGEVVLVDADHREQGPSRLVRRPLVTLQLQGSCPLLPGEIVHWDQAPDKDFTICQITAATTGERVILMLDNPNLRPLPVCGQLACFSALDAGGRWVAPLNADIPWTHRAHEPVPGPIEDDESEAA